MDELGIACNVAAESAVACHNSPFVLDEVCCEACIFLTVVHEWIIVAHHVAILVGPVVEVITGFGGSSDFNCLLVGDCESVCAFNGNCTHICIGSSGSNGAVLCNVFNESEVERDACAVTECHGCRCLANGSIGRNGYIHAIGCKILGSTCCTVCVKVNPYACNSDFLADDERQFNSLSAINLGDYIALGSVGCNTHREDEIFCCALYATEVFSECLGSLLCCGHVCWDNHL